MTPAEAWRLEYLWKYGEEPDLGPTADYDYALAEQLGVQPSRQDDSLYHWPSKGPGGEWLKREGHPTRWMEDYAGILGQPPKGEGAERLVLEALQRGERTEGPQMRAVEPTAGEELMGLLAPGFKGVSDFATGMARQEGGLGDPIGAVINAPYQVANWFTEGPGKALQEGAEGLPLTDPEGTFQADSPLSFLNSRINARGAGVIDAAGILAPIAGRAGSAAARTVKAIPDIAMEAYGPQRTASWIFGGMNAKTADTDALAKAFAMEQRGTPPEEVWKQTGWFRAPWDNRWRFEIDDSMADWAPLLKTQHGKRALEDGMYLRDAVSHPELRAAYPELFDLPVAADLPPGFAAGRWNGNAGLAGGMRLAKGTDPNAGVSSMVAELEKAGRTPNARALEREMSGFSTGLHEFSHGIAEAEGHARGGSTAGILQSVGPIPNKQLVGVAEDLATYARDYGMPPEQFLAKVAAKMPEGTTLRNLYREVSEKYSAAPYLASDLGRLAEAKKKLAIADDPHKAYLSLGGEAEARLVQARRDLTPAQRRELYPLEQMDIMLRQEGIIGGTRDLTNTRGGGPAMSIGDGILGRHVTLADQEGGVLGKTSLETPQPYPLAKMQRWPEQTEMGDLGVATSVRPDKYTGLSSEGVKFIKQFEGPDFRNKTAIHYNNKTGLSLDFSTSCTKRHGGGCNAGACAYCYVEHERTFKEKMGETGAKAKKLVENDYEGELMRMPAEVVTNLNRDGGMRMFSFGDFRPGIDDANVERVLEDARKRGLYIKAITKEPELIAKFGDHPNFRANLSIDYLPRDASNSWTVEDAIKAKAGRENIKLRGVALNMEEAERMAKDKRIDVITLYHGPTGDRAFNMIKEQNPKLVERFGSEEALRAETARWENMAPRNNNVKEFMERNKGRVCCQGGKCSTDPSTKCGFASKAIGALLPGVFVPEWFDEGEPEDF